MSTAARDIETSDNSVLIQHIRELSKQLAKNAVPKLLSWRGVFQHARDFYLSEIIAIQKRLEVTTVSAAAALGIDNVDVDGSSAVGDMSSAALTKTTSGSSSGSVLGKRLSSSSSSSACDCFVETEHLAQLTSQRDITEAHLRDIHALLRDIKILLTGKCKDLLIDEKLF